MTRDPDYLDPEVLKRRAAETGGAGVESSRPRIRRRADVSGVVVGERNSTVLRNVSTSARPVDIRSKQKVHISR